MSNITSCDSGSFSTENTREDAAAAAVKHQSEMLGQFHSPHSLTSTTTTNNSNGSNTNSQPPAPAKKKRSLPGNPGNFSHTHLRKTFTLFQSHLHVYP